ncbi:MAG: hypothetical protein Q8K82_14170 [Gemmatimonadaceae bacterium]|nr:hypothetical protein [Gemmatimonadaceae bacterium]
MDLTNKMKQSAMAHPLDLLAGRQGIPQSLSVVMGVAMPSRSRYASVGRLHRALRVPNRARSVLLRR